jgi:hypothetical protein
MTYVLGRLAMKRLRRSLETDEYDLNYVQRRLTRLDVGKLNRGRSGA